jgi:hypothetical protein
MGNETGSPNFITAAEAQQAAQAAANDVIQNSTQNNSITPEPTPPVAFSFPAATAFQDTTPAAFTSTQNNSVAFKATPDTFSSPSTTPTAFQDTTSSIPAGQKGTDDYFDTAKFDQLLNRLEGSKGRQQRQKSLETRRQIYAQGLAGMMSNF